MMMCLYLVPSICLFSYPIFLNKHPYSKIRPLTIFVMKNLYSFKFTADPHWAEKGSWFLVARYWFKFQSFDFFFQISLLYLFVSLLFLSSFLQSANSHGWGKDALRCWACVGTKAWIQKSSATISTGASKKVGLVELLQLSSCLSYTMFSGSQNL